MNLEGILQTPGDEYELFMKLAAHIGQNFSAFCSRKIYFHITKVSENTSVIDQMREFADQRSSLEYVYIERDKKPGILYQSHGTFIRLLLHGEFYFVEVRVAENSVELVGEKQESFLPICRRSKLTGLEVRMAFAEIGEELLSRSKKAV